MNGDLMSATTSTFTTAFLGFIKGYSCWVQNKLILYVRFSSNYSVYSYKGAHFSLSFTHALMTSALSIWFG